MSAVFPLLFDWIQVWRLERGATRILPPWEKSSTQMTRTFDLLTLNLADVLGLQSMKCKLYNSSQFKFDKELLILPPTTKLQQGNFSQAFVSHSVHGDGASVAEGHAWQTEAMRGGWALPRYYEIQSMSGRYASYWNAFLYVIYFYYNVHIYTYTWMCFNISRTYKSKEWDFVSWSVRSGLEELLLAKNRNVQSNCFAHCE